MRGLQSVFCQNHSSRTSYHTRTDWLQLRINLVTIVPADLQKKTNLTLNNWLDPQIVLGFSARTWYVKWFLFCDVSYFCAGNRSENGNPIESNKYKNKWHESNHHSNN